MPNDADLVELLSTWIPDKATRRRVPVDNPAELFGFAAGERLNARVETAPRPGGSQETL